MTCSDIRSELLIGNFNQIVNQITQCHCGDFTFADYLVPMTMPQVIWTFFLYGSRVVYFHGPTLAQV